MPHRFVYWMVLCMVAAGCSSSGPDEVGRKAAQTELSRQLAAAAAEAPLVIAHRGNSGSFPENTLSAFRSANALGVDAIEFDVRQTRDGVLICLHDALLDRTTDAARHFGEDRVELSSLDASQLEELDAGSWKGPEHVGEALPSLSAALPLIAADSVPIIERKGGDAKRYLDLLHECELEDQAVITAFDWRFLAELRAKAPALTLGAIGDGEFNDERLAELDALGVSLVHWNHRYIDARAVAKLQARGYLVWLYTIDNGPRLIDAARMGVDGITTNEPARLIGMRARGEIGR